MQMSLVFELLQTEKEPDQLHFHLLKSTVVCVCVRRFLCGKGFFLCASVFKKIKKISMTCKGTPRPHRVLTNFLTSFKDLDGC
jgi:hypothetical protein